MKYFLLVLYFFLLNSVRLFPQDNHMVIRTGAGYYMDTFTSDDGPIIWLEAGYKLKSDFIINGRFSISSIDWRIREGTFKDYLTIQQRQMYDLVFSRPLRIKGKHFLEPGFGFKMKKEYLLKPDIYVANNNGSRIIYTSYSDVFWEIGFTICIDYYFQLRNNFYLGMRIDSNLIWALGFEGLTISPLFGFRF